METVQKKLEDKADNKMRADWRDFMTAYSTVISSGVPIIITHEKEEIRIYPDRIKHALEDCFMKTQRAKYIKREVNDFMHKFQQMSEQFEELLGFEEISAD